jgi:hypothetical protein
MASSSRELDPAWKMQVSRPVASSRPGVRWLSCLVWPGEGDRAPRLSAAIAARRDPPAVHRGDLLTDLPALAAQAPAGATLVIYHSSVLYYVAPDRREQFADTIRSLGVPSGLSSEAPGILPGIAASAPDEQMCVIAHDGRAIALANSHGTWLQWLQV